jgi:hypothetical protein
VNHSVLHLPLNHTKALIVAVLLFAVASPLTAERKTDRIIVHKHARTLDLMHAAK